MSGEENHSYQFKSFRLNVEERQLLNDGKAVALTPKAFDVLVALVERNGHLVEKDELLRTVWSDSFVEEVNVARIVHTLRKKLGEDENGNKFIETVAKKGYRFVADVSEVREMPESETANGNQDFSTVAKVLRSVSEPPASASGFSAAFDQPAHAGVSDLPQTITPPTAEPKQTTRVVLFSIGFLSAVFLLVLLSFDFHSDVVNSSGVKSIAVLPVQPLTAENREPIYELGIADSLILRLNSAKNFRVRPLSTTRKYADIEHDPLAAGRELLVDYVLASNYQLTDGKIRVTAQLFNVASGQIEETYKSEKDAGDLFKMQDQIADEMGDKLLGRFATLSSSPNGVRGTNNADAYRLYLQGKNLTAKRSAADALKAIEYFEQAVRLDPNYAQAYAGMAYAYRASGSLGGLPREQFEKAKVTVNKALELDNNLAEAYAVRGDLKSKYEWDWVGAEKDLLRAIELEPNNDLAHGIYAELLAERGRFDEAMAEKEIALAINPNSLVYQRDRGRILYFARRYDEAIEQLKRVLEVDENFRTAYDWLWFAHAMKGDYVGAFEWFMKEQKLKNPEHTEVYQTAYETGGWKEVRRKQLELSKLNADKNTVNYYAIARQSALLGEKEQAFEYLNKAFEKPHSQLVMLNVEPAFDTIRDDFRFDKMLKRVGLR